MLAWRNRFATAFYTLAPAIGAALKLAASSRRAAMDVDGPCPMKRHCAGERPLLRRSPVVRRASCDLQRQASAACLMQRTHAGALYRWADVALKITARARYAALVVVGSNAKEKLCVSERPLFLSARPWCDVPAAASSAKPAPHVSHSAGALFSLSLERRRSTRACCARARCRAGCGRLIR